MYSEKLLCGDIFAYNLSCTRERAINMVSDVLSAYERHQSGLVERFKHMLVNAGKHELNAAVLGAQVELLEVVNACTINKRHLTHTNDTHFLVVFANAAADLIKLICDAEEIWSINLIYLSMRRDMKHLKVLSMKTDIGLMGGI